MFSTFFSFWFVISRWNFRKANWESFRNNLDAELDLPLIDSLDEDEANTHITSAILNAAKSSIPRGSVRKYSPFWNAELEKSVADRQAGRKAFEDDNSPENRRKYNKAVAETKLLTKQHKKKVWTEKCAELNLREGGRQAWKLLDSLSGANNKANPKPFTKDAEVLTSDVKKAEHLNKHFAHVTKASRKTDLDRSLKKSLQEEETKESDSTPDIFSND